MDIDHSITPLAQLSGAAPAARREAYREHALDYDRRTGSFNEFRRVIADALPLRPGDAVIDVGCGTGLCFSMLRDKVGRHGRVIGIDASPDMVAVARNRVAHHGWGNIALVESSVAEADIAMTADAALFCAVHDILRSPPALRTVVNSLRPGAPVAAGGGKWAAPWMIGLNLRVWAVHAPYVDTFEGFDRPWTHLERLVDDLNVRELAWGSGFVATGRARPERIADSGEESSSTSARRD
jgi:SAM-dependent methyltransferase